MRLHFIALLLVCQLGGEAAAVALELPVPGPVLGMMALFAGLWLVSGPPTGLTRTANGLLEHLALLFVPAAVGGMLRYELLTREWLAIVLALVISTFITLTVTGWLMHRLAPDDGGAR